MSSAVWFQYCFVI